MIVSFANRATERFAREGKSKFAGMDIGRAMARLQVLKKQGDTTIAREVDRFCVEARSGEWGQGNHRKAHSCRPLIISH